MFKHGADKRKRTVAPMFVRTGHYDTRSCRREHKTAGTKGNNGIVKQYAGPPICIVPVASGFVRKKDKLKRRIKKTS
jgi:hypothetical protein